MDTHLIFIVSKLNAPENQMKQVFKVKFLILQQYTCIRLYLNDSMMNNFQYIFSFYKTISGSRIVTAWN